MSNKKENRFFSWFKKKIDNKSVNILKDLKIEKKKNHHFLETKNQNDLIIKNKKKSDQSILKLFKTCLIKTKIKFKEGIKSIFFGEKDTFYFEELEEQLLLADVGIKTTNKIIDEIKKKVNFFGRSKNEYLYSLLKENMLNILREVEKPININVKKLFVMLLVGVNGVGKTTTVGKLAYFYKSIGKSVNIVAGDTFRAAGIEQLQVIGKKYSIPVISEKIGTDPASIAFNAIHLAKKNKIDILIIDTAGRLHNKIPLMEELKKIKRVIKKIENIIFNQTILVLDASIGQNSMKQVESFNKYLGLNSIILTKLDGTSKGGIIFNLASTFKIPVQYIGIGEKITDLSYFKSQEFVKEIF
ncbi:signal recognition particle-docking protein FtsY [Buchnera aphidicola]|uniref:signal recognition particle-docking protein FtsY n=1 Tax=Buchnera aphidicola TaxID=9 RepID=UPI003463B560